MHLPEPPNDEEKYLYLDQNKWLLYSFGILSSLLIILGGLFFSASEPAFYFYLFFVIINAIYLGMGYTVGIFAKPFDLKKHETLTNSKFREYYTVDIFLPSAGEDISILKNTYEHVSRIDYPKYFMNIYVLDDSHRKEVKKLAEEFGFAYIARENPGELKKAGNLRYAYRRSINDLILVLDADFVPREDILHELTDYFRDQSIAIVQSPQYFRQNKGTPWIERGAASVQELFYRMIQANRNHFNAAICCGTCAIYRRSAFSELGGTYPALQSEDSHTGLWALKQGYRVVYVPLNLAAGLCPDTIEAFFRQSYRWATGSLSIMMNKELFWQTKLSFMQRISFLSGQFFYIATALGLFFIPLPGILMIWLNPSHVLWQNLAFAIPSFVFGTLHLKIWSKNPYGVFSLKTRNISYFAHLFAILDRVLGSVQPWLPTGVAQKKDKNIVRFKISLLIYTMLVPGLIAGGMFYQDIPISDYNFWPYLAISAFYFYINLSCLFAFRWRSATT